MDRVHELGDAAVPFAFDVPAMFYTEDAPTLENSLHKHFDNKRLNLVNGRKEFFNVTFDELEEFAKAKNHKIEFTRLAEAREYRQSIALRSGAAAKMQIEQGKAEVLPQSIESRCALLGRLKSDVRTTSPAQALASL